jgi:hypothetical protein
MLGFVSLTAPSYAVLLTNNRPPLAVFNRPGSNKRPTALEKILG